jgi:hypothetical protein
MSLLQKKQSKLKIFQEQPFVKILLSQDYKTISVSKEKWTDPLFAPEESSLYSGKTEFSGYSAGTPEIPSNLSVN